MRALTAFHLAGGGFGQAQEVIEAAPASPCQRLPRQGRDRTVTYLTNNHQHMKYDKALAKGWPT
jgi:hypothetical protein